tara:strand:+ start:1024 stop:1191 length:168 start_codon:yes stop_codon:yes gene_type:complete
MADNKITEYKIEILKFLLDSKYRFEEGTHNKEFVHIKFLMPEDKANETDTNKKTG